MSSPSSDALRAWRVFVETAWALLDVLDTELQEGAGITLRWYDVLVHCEERPDGLPMTELAGRILSSKSGLTRIVDAMERAGLLARVRPPEDRRVVLVALTPAGHEQLRSARLVHRDGIERHFAAHVREADLPTLERSLERVREHVRPLRPGRISAHRASP